MIARRVLLLAALAIASAPAAGHAAPDLVATRIGVAHEVVDGAAGKQRLAGKVTVTTPATWTRTSLDTAPTAVFTPPAVEGCSATVQLSVRAVATRESAKARALRVTQAPVSAVMADRARPRGWLRAVQLPQGEKYGIGASMYGIAIVKLAHARWLDVRAYARFTGCTDQQVRTGAAAAGVGSALRTANTSTARIVDRARSG